MGFDDILGEWRDKRRGPDAVKANEALSLLNANWPQVFENLDRDKNIRQSKREELLEQLLRSKVNNVDIVSKRVEAFCQTHQGLGPKQPTAQKSQLGHVQDRSKLEDTFLMDPKSGFGHGKTREKGAGAYVDKILRMDLAEQQSEMGYIELSHFQMWSFYQSRYQNAPFHNVSKATTELVSRLGLREVDSDAELLLWSHQLTHQEARIPTTFDAAFDANFRPGGITRPLNRGGALREVVHAPVSGFQLTSPIERAS